MSTELLPCPFCGGEAEVLDFERPDFDEDHENFGGSCIVCKQCQANTAVVFGFKETLHSSWNERASPRSVTPPDGWVMVPVEPTSHQLTIAVDIAMRVSLGGDYKWHDYMADVYRAMLSSAPKPPASTDRDAIRREVAWLLEWPADDNLPSRWWHPEKGWMIDANKAMRMCRKEDVEAYQRSRNLHGRPSEHVFVALVLEVTEEPPASNADGEGT